MRTNNLYIMASDYLIGAHEDLYMSYLKTRREGG